MKVKMLRDRILVKKIEKENISPGGIVLSGENKDESVEGEVIGAGNGNYDSNGTLIPLSVGIGDIVLFSKYAGTEVAIDSEKFLVMTENDILAVRK